MNCPGVARAWNKVGYLPVKTALSGSQSGFPAFSRTRGMPRASCKSPNRSWDAGLARKLGIARAARLLRSNTSSRRIAASLALGR